MSKKLGLKLTPLVGLSLILLFAIPRFYVVLEANQTGDYRFTSVIFMILIFLPFVLLRKEGLKQIGWSKVKDARWVLRGFIVGIILSSIGFLVGWLLYEYSVSNWYVYISRSFNTVPEAMDVTTRFKFFILFAVVSMLFSPLGEELMYRGLIHQSFAPKFGENVASKIDSSAFALTHLAHFGFVYDQGEWQFLFVPALLWVALMYFLCRLFFLMKIKSGSLFGPISCHAGFNLGMTFWIFYFVL